MANDTQNPGSSAGTGTATKKAPVRLKIPLSDRAAYLALPEDEKPLYMSDEEQKAFEALTELKRREYGFKLQRQTAEDELKAIRAAEEKDRKDRKEAAEKEKGVKQIITDVRKDEVQILRDKPLSENQALQNRIKALGFTDEQQPAVFERILKDSAAPISTRLLPKKPAYNLTHSLVMVKRGQLAEPTDGSRPDITLSNNLRAFGMIEPLLVVPQRDAESGNPVDGFYTILSGKRRYWTLEDDTEYPAVIVTGFPDEATEEKAEVIVNRIRSFNVLDAAIKLTAMKQRGASDQDLRRDLGFKTGEIDKILSILDLTPDLQAVLKAGAMTPTVALQVAKLPDTLKKELVADYETRKKENSSARISEADVNLIRQKRAADAISRDASTLAGLADQAGVLDKDSKTGVDSTNAAPPTVKAKGKKK